jgi:hypothetical protein
MLSINSRIWFILSSYNSSQNREDWDFENLPASINNWNAIDWNQAKNCPYIFFSRSPITFGHSIVVIPKPPNSNSVHEAQFFRWAAQFIEITISIFYDAFVQREIHHINEFHEIANFTSSHGKYLKTLILKANANEDISNIYKIHLVPYFSSHEIVSQKRFRNAYPEYNLADLKGGLLGWIGQQEDRVDKREISLLFNERNEESNKIIKEIEKLSFTFRNQY